MKDEDFQRRLESILGKLYKIDHEVEEYLKRKETDPRMLGYDRKPYLKNEDVLSDGKYGPRYCRK